MAPIEKRLGNGKVSYRAATATRAAGTASRPSAARSTGRSTSLSRPPSCEAPGPTPPTLVEWLETWWESASDLRPSTKARDRAYLSSLVLSRFGTTPLAAIRQLDVQAWVAELTARGFAPATVVKAYQLLGRTITAAVTPT